MGLLLFVLTIIAVLAAIAGLFFPKAMAFWCSKEDRTRPMAFSVYLVLGLAFAVLFVFSIPEPAPPQVVFPKVSRIVEKQRPALTAEIFFQEVRQRLTRKKQIPTKGTRLFLLMFGKSGAAIQLKMNRSVDRKKVAGYAHSVVQAMVATFKNHDWIIREPFLIECQTHIVAPPHTNGSNPPGRHFIGFARYHPEMKNITWFDYEAAKPGVILSKPNTTRK